MKKKFLVALLSVVAALCLCFGLAACGEEAPQEPSDTTKTETDGGNNNSSHIHAYGDWEIVVPATHTTTGTRRKYCSCGEHIDESIAKTTAHEYGNWQITRDATHLLEGEKRRTCPCGAVETDTIPKTTAHEYGNWQISRDATHLLEGEKQRTCPCGAVETDTIPKTTTHTFLPYSKQDATCTAAGEEVLRCECGEEQHNTIPQKKHTYNKGVCSVCGSVEGLIAFRTLEVSDDDTVYGKVSNQTETFSFIHEILFADDVTFTVSSDLSGTPAIPSKTVALEEGDNTFYILASRGQELKLYTVTVRRRPMYTVNFETMGSAVSSQQVEEDSQIAPPAATKKLGYTFTHWMLGGEEVAFPYMAEEGILQTDGFHVNFQAAWQIDPRMENFNFDSDTDTCTILGVKDKAVTEAVIPAYVTLIEEDAFSDWSALESITVEGTNQNYSSQDGILYNKKKTEFVYVPLALKGNVTIPDGISSIGTLFSGYSELTGISIPNSVVSISEGAFNGCSHLESITLPFVGESRNVNSLNYHFLFGSIFGRSSYDGALETIQYYYHDRTASSTTTSKFDWVTFYIPATLKSVTVGSSVTSICLRTFYNCYGLTDITISDNVTSIEDYAFAHCSSLETVTIGRGLKHVSEEAFWECDRLENVYISDFAAWCEIDFSQDANPLHYAKHLYLDGEEVTKLVIPDGVTKIGNYAFDSCSWMTGEWKIPDSVTEIGYGAFYKCSGLTGELKISDNVTSIGRYAFYDCNGLQGVTIGSGITAIEPYTFYSCTMADIAIPDGVTSIGEYAFAYCFSLKNVKFGDESQLQTIGRNAFYKCSSLENFVIPAHVTSIGFEAFMDCSELIGVTIGSGVKNIGDEAFRNCSGLKSVYYMGTPSDWKEISIGYTYSSYLTYATRYYFSDQTPTAEQWQESKNWWHYDEDGETIILWTKDA